MNQGRADARAAEPALAGAAVGAALANRRKAQ